MIIVACVISIGHRTDTASMSMFVSPVLFPFSVAVCRCAAVDTRTCSGPERCVLKCTCTLSGARITAERDVHQSVDEGGSTVHVVLYAKNRATSDVPQSMQTACIRTTCSIATFLAGDLAQKVAQPKSLRPVY